MTQTLPVIRASYYQQALDHFFEAIERRHLSAVVFLGMFPVLGVIPSAGAAIYSAARTADRLAVVCLRSIQMANQKIEHQREKQYKVLEKAKEEALDYLAICIGTSTGALTLGGSYFFVLLTRRSVLDSLDEFGST